MKKIVFVFLILLLGACGTKQASLKDKPLYEVLIQEGGGGANIHFFEILSEKNEIAMLQNDEKLKKKIHPDDVTNSNFIVLNLGEKPTTGYTIGIESVVETEKNIVITVKESEPAPDAIVSQVISYPYTIVKINSKKEIIIN